MSVGVLLLRGDEVGCESIEGSGTDISVLAMGDTGVTSCEVTSARIEDNIATLSMRNCKYLDLVNDRGGNVHKKGGCLRREPKENNKSKEQWRRDPMQGKKGGCLNVLEQQVRLTRAHCGG